MQTPAPARIRLLLLTDTSIAFSGGSERFLRNLVTLLPRDRYDITVVQLDAGGFPESEKHHLADGDAARIVHLPVEAIYGRGGLRALRTLRSMVAGGGFDIVQSHHEKSDLINALLPRRPGCVHISNRRDMGYKKSAKLKWLFRHLNPRFDCVVAPSQQILGELARSEALEAGRMLWIPNGVDTQRFHPRPPPARAAIRQSLSLQADALVFGCVARLTPEKRHVDLVDAFARMHATFPQARLVLLGDGPLQGEIEARVVSLGVAGAVRMTGMRPDVEAILPALDVGMLVSSTEGMSNAILEMMASGLPMIATDVGGNRSLVASGATGLLVPARAPGRLAEAMLALAADPALRHRMGEAARQRVEREFSLAAMVRAFDQAYRRLADVA
ncbi:glycosyltransferase [Luteimonas lutimaris]|uniref:Glycosyltransferase family 4 protein n=1 Tax=Luteimonas lutimaris TaxID=698645 RepID=A0ABP7MJZ4_9GAMM